MIKNTLLFVVLLVLYSVGYGQQAEKTFLITQKYLNYPIRKKSKEEVLVRVNLMVDGKKITYSDMRLAQGEPDYWMFTDVSAYQGKKVTLVFDQLSAGIEKIYQSDSFRGEENLYKEKYRPQFHFSTRRGWNNDPNGLVYLDGEYHLYYQHNPYDVVWGNMTWGHAVSSDLIHWKELPVTLLPDDLGTMFSGSAVIDENNTSGWGKNALVAAYTACDNKLQKQTQCMAYSKDKGRTFTKYEKNPVIDSKEKWNTKKTRDPKVFWFAPSDGWVMALFELNGISIYTSKDLKDWKYESHTVGFHECPELFELPVDDKANNKKWVMYGASGNYRLGSFDGKFFTPEAGNFQNTFGSQYASQTYNNTPDGRRVQIGWGRVTHCPEMPFSQMMTFPTKLSLRSTIEGIRLFSEPVEEIGKLHEKAYKWNRLNLEDANKKLQQVKGDLIHLKLKIELSGISGYSISYRGNDLLMYDGTRYMLNKVNYAPVEPVKNILQVEMLIDKTSVEIFFDNGKRVDVLNLPEPKLVDGLKITGNENGKGVLIQEMEVYELKSAWSN
jgi:sucrose-6-phosphate hydrolase SacC (GH32 family)